MVIRGSASTATDNDRKNKITHSVEPPFSGFPQHDLLFSNFTNVRFASLTVLHELWVLFVKLGKSKMVLKLIVKKKLSQIAEETHAQIQGCRIFVFVFESLEDIVLQKEGIAL